jgi:TonB family protein
MRWVCAALECPRNWSGLLIRIIFLAASSFSLAVNAADSFFDTNVKVTIMSVDIDAAGKITAMQLPDGLDQRLAMQLQNHVRDSAFEPSEKNGEKVSSSTHLIIHYDPTAESDTGTFTKIISMDNGPMIVKRTGFRYPSSAITRRIQGLVLVRATIKSDGLPSNVHVAMQWPESRSLSRSAVRAVEKWRFEPDKVDGLAIASDVLIPIQFCIEQCSARLAPDRIHQLISSAQSASQAHQSPARTLPLLPLVQVVASRMDEENNNQRAGIGKGRFQQSR